MASDIFRLNLLSPLSCLPAAAPSPFDYGKENDSGHAETEAAEMLFCFELKDAFSFEPEKDRFLENLIFGGKILPFRQGGSGADKDFRTLPKGGYLFAQKKSILGRGDIIDLAVEIQQEALWQRLKPENKLYLRFLAEDGNFVTQILRPYTQNNPA